MPASASPGGVRRLDITPEHAGQRFDNFLLRELKGAPKFAAGRREIAVSAPLETELYILQMPCYVKF